MQICQSPESHTHVASWQGFWFRGKKCEENFKRKILGKVIRITMCKRNELRVHPLLQFQLIINIFIHIILLFPSLVDEKWCVLITLIVCILILERLILFSFVLLPLRFVLKIIFWNNFLYHFYWSFHHLNEHLLIVDR